MTPHSACNFCGRTDSPIHKEDVFAKWIARQYPKKTWIQITHRNTGREVVKRKDFDLVVYAPCQRCNNGWMSTLEGEAIPIIRALMRGEKHVLTSNHQLTLSRWMLKTAMTYEFLSDEPRFFRPRDYTAFYESRVIPTGTAIWIAFHQAEHRSSHHRSGHHPLALSAGSNNPTRADGYSATFAFDRLAIQLFSFRPKNDGDRGVAKFVVPGYRELNIWPAIRDWDWPPPVALDTPMFEEFATRFERLKT